MFRYASGPYNEEVIRRVQHAGYKGCTVRIHSMSTDFLPFECQPLWKRIRIPAQLTFGTLTRAHNAP
jgi:hypothetical protein